MAPSIQLIMEHGDQDGGYALLALVCFLLISSSFFSFLFLQISSDPRKGSYTAIFPSSLLLGLGVWAGYLAGLMALPWPVEEIDLGVHALFLVLTLVVSVSTTFYGFSLMAWSQSHAFSRGGLSGLLIGLGFGLIFYGVLESLLLTPHITYNWVHICGGLFTTTLIMVVSMSITPRIEETAFAPYIGALLAGFASLNMYVWGILSVSFSDSRLHLLPANGTFDSSASQALVIGCALVAFATVYGAFRAVCCSRTSGYVPRWFTSSPHRTTIDPHTGLKDYNFFRERLEQTLQRHQRSDRQFALLLLDIEGVELLEGSRRGQEKKEALLKALVANIVLCMRSRDTVCRVRGHTFALMAEDLVDASEASHVASRIMDCIQDAATAVALDSQVSGKIGVSVYPDDGTNIGDLLSRSETAMVSVRDKIGNTCAFFDPEMNIAQPEMLSLPHLLRLAVKYRQFRLLLQPQYNADDNQIIGAEALLRWNHPTRGMLAPVHFIGVAEKIGLMPEIDSWVAHEACRLVKRWKSLGAPFDTLELSINARPHLFTHGTYASMLRRLLKETKVNPARLLLEIPAFSTSENGQTVEEVAESLKKLGVGVVLENFGTGLASMVFLQSVTAREVKIDRSLLENLSPGSDAEKVLQALLDLTQALNMKAVVEGVETSNMVEHLRRLGFNAFQGYALGQPCPSDVFETTVLDTNRKRRQEHDRRSSPGTT